MINRNQSPFVRIIVPFTAGIVGVLKIGHPPPWVLAVFFGMVTFYVVWYSLLAGRISYRYRWVYGAVINLALLLGGGSLASERLRSAAGLTTEPGTYVVLELLEDPVEREKTFRFTARLIALADSSGWRPAAGVVMVYLQKSPSVDSLRYGNRLVLRASVREVSGPRNPGEFDFRRHLYMRGITSQVYAKPDQWQKLDGSGGNALIRWSLRTRMLFMGLLRDSGVGDREFALAAAIILGYDEYLDPEQKDQFAAAGAMHILCVSGLHVGILSVVLTKLLFFMGNRGRMRILRLTLTVTAIWAYAAITGFSPSVLRAATMFSFMYAGRTFRRRVSIYNMLAASAFLLLLHDPLMIARVGFQLSYLAVGGIVTLYSPINAVFSSRFSIADRVWQLTAVSLAATLATFPLSIYYFHRFPNLFLLTNLVAIPASFLILYNGLALLAFSFNGIAFGILSFTFGKVLSFLDYSIAAVDAIPYSSTDEVFVSAPELFLLFGIITLLSWLLVNPHRNLLLGLVILGNALLLSFALRKHQAGRQRTLVVYSIPGHTAVEFIHGRESVFLCDSALLASPRKIDYAAQGCRMASGVRDTRLVRLDEHTFKSSWLFKSGDCMEFAGVRMGMIDLQVSRNTDLDPLHLDLLLLRGQNRGRLPDLTALPKSDLVLLDPSLAPWVAGDLREQLCEGGIPVWDIREQAYQIKLP